MNKKLAVLVLVCLIAGALAGSRRAATDDDDEFSEFDDEFESVKQSKPSPTTTPSPSKQVDEDDFESITVEDDTPPPVKKDEPVKKKTPVAEENKKPKNDFASLNTDELDNEEFENFVDDDEFETSTPASRDDPTPTKKDSKSMPNLKIADVPLHLMSTGNWQNYVWEICMLGIIAIYMVNFFYGKSKNYQLVNHWYQTHRGVLERNFAVVGDDGLSVDVPKTDQNESGSLIKDSESNYALWCTGRHACEGMLIQLKLIKRQDLINGLFMQLLKPQCDQIIISVEYPQQDDLDSYVFCLCNRKRAQQMFADYQDISTYCVEKKLGTGASIVDAKYTELLSAGVMSKYVMLNEIGEVPNNVLDKSVCAFLNKYPDMVEYLLISDQYVGLKTLAGDDPSSSQNPSSNGSPANETLSSGIPKSRSILVLCLNVGGRGLGTTVEDMERMQPAIQLAIYLADKAPHIRLSKEAKVKALKKRKDIAEQYLKLTHKQRQEAAMLRKEEKRRAEKEKIMNESDPEKQKKLEEKELKREKKKTLSKMKQIKIKAM